MINATFTESPLTRHQRSYAQNRLLTYNLLNNDKINIKFSSFSYHKFDLLFNSNIENKNKFYQMMQPKTSMGLTRSWLQYYAFSDQFLDLFLKTTISDYVFITCITPMDFYFIKELLNKGCKVIAGGSLFKIYDLNFIKTLLVKIGLNKNLLNNIIFIKGNIDFNFDLYEVVKNWKDVITDEIDNSHLFKSYDDLTFMYPRIPKYAYYFSTMFYEGCFYGKCKFCDVKNIPTRNLMENLTPDQVIEYIAKFCNKYKLKSISVEDLYLQETDEIKYIFKNLRDQGFTIAIKTGIIKLKNEKHLKFIDEYVDSISFGVESMIDYTLDSISKGYHYIDILDAFNNLKQIKNVNLVLFMLMDLPFQSIKELKLNYQRLYDVVIDIRKYHRTIVYNNLYKAFPNNDLIKNSKHYREIDQPDNKYVNGIWYAYNQLKQYNVNNNLPIDLCKPFIRYDLYGKLLKSDFHYLDEAYISDIYAKEY